MKRAAVFLPLLTLATCISDRPDRDPAGPDPDARQVRIANFAYAPPEISVPEGAAVVWTNEDDVLHTVTAEDGSFDSSTFGRDGMFRLVAEREGTFRYFCSVHPFLRGTLHVTGG